ncbi:MAG: hypothetical protein M1835_007354 [Candelina submexicana]|nr:MAG: hypothetical protein M1835_007354 [Candelina submexicana]
MGWFWGEPSSSAEVPGSPRNDELLNGTNVSTDKDLIEKPPPILTRDEQAEADFKDLVKELQAEIQQHTATRKSKTDGSDSEISSISPDSLYPTTMSCRQAFDSAFYCQSMGGQFNNLYRYGEVRNCSEKWSQFWFCMRTKSQPAEKKRAMIQEHYRQRAVKYKVGPSSEDIWEVRNEPVENAFALDPDTLPSTTHVRRAQS